MVISVRHASISRPDYKKWYGNRAEKCLASETLLAACWITVNPDFLLDEIDMNLTRVGAFEDTFKFKILSPVFPPTEEKLLKGSRFMCTFPYTTLEIDQANRKKQTENMAIVWTEFLNFNMRSMKTSMKNVPPNFDQIYDYLNSLLFEKENVDFEKTYDARLWLCELFINSQAFSH